MTSTPRQRDIRYRYSGVRFTREERRLAMYESRQSARRLRDLKALGAMRLAEPARGRFPYQRARLCECRECAKLDLMRLQGIPGAHQLALPF